MAYRMFLIPKNRRDEDSGKIHNVYGGLRVPTQDLDPVIYESMGSGLIVTRSGEIIMIGETENKLNGIENRLRSEGVLLRRLRQKR